MPLQYEDFGVRLASLDGSRLRIEVDAAQPETRDLAALARVADPMSQATAASPSPEETGQALYEFLFQGAIEAQLENRLGSMAARPDAGLRIVLRFAAEDPEAALLGRFPWELLYRKKSQQFLALDPRTPVVRRLGEEPSGAAISPLRGKLRVLVVSGGEKEIAQRSFEGLPMAITYLESPSREELSRALASKRSHVLHLRVPWQNPELAAASRSSPDLRLVILGPGQPGFTLAQALEAPRAPAVLSLEPPAGNAAEIAFHQALYHALAEGSSVTEAVGAGRGAVYATRTEESLRLPVLFAGARERVATSMSATALSTLWTAVALLTFSLSLNVYSLSQKWHIELPPFQFLEGGTYGVAVYGIVWGVPSLALLLALTHRHLRRHPGKSFADRLPVAFRIYPSLLGPSWRTFQATSFFLFLLFPMVAQVHFNSKIRNATVCDWTGCSGDCQGWCPQSCPTWERVSWEQLQTRRYRFEPPQGRNDPWLLSRFYPFWEPLAFLLVDLALLGYFLWVCRGLFWEPWAERRAARDTEVPEDQGEDMGMGSRGAQEAPGPAGGTTATATGEWQGRETPVAWEYDDFVVRFAALGDRQFRAQIECPTGSGAEALNAIRSELPALYTLPAWWRGQLRDFDADQPRWSDPEKLRAIGAALYQSLFHGSVGALFESSLGFASVRQRGLRVVLRFDPREPEIELLSQQPWELLCRQEGSRNTFLALDPRTPVVRHLDNVPRGTELEPLQETLRVLVAIADAEGLKLSEEVEILRESVSGFPVELTFLVHASRETLAQALARERSHVLHYLGHGGFDERTGTGFLALEKPLSGRELATLIRNTTSLRFVFLNSCQTAKAKTQNEAFSGVANALVLQGVPAVLAMQASIQDDHAIEFTRAVYGSLATGSALEEAVGAGRRVLREGGSFAIPVLFTRTREKVLSLMSPTGLSTLWTLLGILAAGLTFNVLSRSQGWGRGLPGLPLEGVTTVGAFPYGIILGIPILALLLGVTHLYVRSRKRPSPIDRLPIAFGITPAFLGRTRRAFQAAFLSLFLLLPLAAQVCFYGEICRFTVKDWETGQTYQAWELVPWKVLQRDKLGIVAPEDPNTHESFYPVWEPLGFLLAELALFGYFVRIGRELFHRS